VCEWCGESFTPPVRRGPAPRYCRPSHRQRAYEARRYGQPSLPGFELGGDADDADTAGAPIPVTVTGNGISERDVRTALRDSVDRLGLPAVIGESRVVEAGRPAELRRSLEALSAAVSEALSSAGLPEITAGDEAVWALVAPVSRALRQAREVIDGGGRSALRLDTARQALLAAGAALVDPDAAHNRPIGTTNLAVVVPGPDGSIPAGVLARELESGTRTLRWYPDAGTGHGDLFAAIMGRPDGYRYRWQDKRVWDDLAADLIVFCCGWHSDPHAVPPVLKRSRDRLATQLRMNFATGTWAIQPTQIVDWLAHDKVVTVLELTTL